MDRPRPRNQQEHRRRYQEASKTVGSTLMEPPGSAQFAVMESEQPAAPPGAILQLKVRLLEFSPMMWRRVLVPESMSLRELHGVVQLAMGWEGIHLFEFAVRGVRYARPDLSGMSTDVALSDFRFRRNARFRYVYDMFCEWEHEIRVGERLAAEPGKRDPRCVGGARAVRP